MQNNFEKFLFLAVVIGVVVFSSSTHPSWFISSNASNADSVKMSTSSRKPPILILPALSADIAAQSFVASSSPVAATATVSPPLHPANAPSLGAEASLIADLQTGKNFLNVNADERWPLASVTKLMTAVAATDALAQTQKITITAAMTAVDPTEQILQVGDTYTVSDLLRVMLLPSNNVAAEALADFYGRDRLLAAMNAKAADWGMGSTYYDDPSGLSAANESTANDLLHLAQNIYVSYPQILAITRMPQAIVTNLTTGKPVIVKSINNFAGQADFVGGKTGYTDQADGNLLSIFSYKGNLVFIVVLGTTDSKRFNDTQELYNWFKANNK